MTPKARESRLLVYQVEDEVVVYDRTRKQAHRLNEAAARVWNRLDGEKTVSEIAGELDVDESVVALAVDDLASAQLLESGEPLSVSRRSALRRVASAAAVGVLLPLVTSISAPLAAMAKSGRDRPRLDRPPGPTSLADCRSWERYGFFRSRKQCVRYVENQHSR